MYSSFLKKFCAFFRELDINTSTSTDRTEETTTKGFILCGSSFVIFTCIIAICSTLRVVFGTSKLILKLVPSAETRNTLRQITRDINFFLLTLNLTFSFLTFLLQKMFRDALKMMFSRPVSQHQASNHGNQPNKPIISPNLKQQQNKIRDDNIELNILARKIIQAKFGSKNTDGDNDTDPRPVYRVQWVNEQAVIQQIQPGKSEQVRVDLEREPSEAVLLDEDTILRLASHLLASSYAEDVPTDRL